MSDKYELSELLNDAMAHIDRWEERWGPYTSHPSMNPDKAVLEQAFERYLHRLEDNYPFFHPRYVGQMLKPPHRIAVAAYLAAMRINPNNHALDGGPATGEMEKEVIHLLAGMVGFPDETLGHLTGGGTVANLEALWVAREQRPGKRIAFSDAAHYTHDRMCRVLAVDSCAVATNIAGQMKLDALEDELKTGTIGTVVFTAGTTGLGSVDPLDEGISLCREYGARVHVDAAYGGFFSILAAPDVAAPEGFPAADFEAIARADSVVIDPHKHGLQPYGCGSVLFRDPSVGRVYKHESPYTYFTSDELHLGEISLECSRSGAAAGAFWCTLQALPPRPDKGLGPLLRACLRAARKWAVELEASNQFDLYAHPQTDIVAYAPAREIDSLSALDTASRQLFRHAMDAQDEPVFLSLYRLPASSLTARFPYLAADRPDAAVLRSVLMKPEHETAAGELVRRLEAIT